MGSCTNLIACALCETWKSAFASHPLRQPPLLLPLLRWGLRQLLCSRGNDQSSGDAVDPPLAGPGSAKHTGELEDSALLEQGEGKRREGRSWDSHVPQRAHPGSHVRDTRLRSEGKSRVSHCRPRFSYFSLSAMLTGQRRAACCTPPCQQPHDTYINITGWI